MRLKRWVRVLLSLIVILTGFFIWKQTGRLGELAQKDTIYLVLCIGSWLYLVIGQMLIYEKIWK